MIVTFVSFQVNGCAQFFSIFFLIFFYPKMDFSDFYVIGAIFIFFDKNAYYSLSKEVNKMRFS